MKPAILPQEVDLRDFMFMPLDVARLRDSDAAALSTGDGFRAAVLLWCVSWHQVPAGSLPNDERALARFAGFGRDMKGWEVVSADALRGFIECDDGRLYHPVVAEKALEGWLEKLSQRKTSAAGNAAKHQTPFDPKPFDDQIAEARRMLKSLNPNSKSLSKRVPRGLPSTSRKSPNGSATGGEREVNGAPVDLPSTSQEKGRDTEGTLKGLSSSLRSEGDVVADAEAQAVLVAGRPEPPRIEILLPAGEPDSVPAPAEDPDAAFYRRGREILGGGAGGRLTKLKQHFAGNLTDARAMLEYAATRDNPSAYIGGVLDKPRGPPVAKTIARNPRMIVSKVAEDFFHGRSH